MCPYELASQELLEEDGVVHCERATEGDGDCLRTLRLLKDELASVSADAGTSEGKEEAAVSTIEDLISRLIDAFNQDADVCYDAVMEAEELGILPDIVRLCKVKAFSRNVALANRMIPELAGELTRSETDTCRKTEICRKKEVIIQKALAKMRERRRGLCVFNKVYPTSDAFLLINYLAVDGPASRDFVERITEEMIIPASRDYGDGEDDEPFPIVGMLPDAMPSMFTDRSLTKKGDELSYDVGEKMLTIDVAPRASCATTPVGDIMRHRANTATRERRCHIPDDAAHYAFVHPCARFERGAFVYLDKENSVVCVNEVHYEPRRAVVQWHQPKIGNMEMETFEQHENDGSVFPPGELVCDTFFGEDRTVVKVAWICDGGEDAEGTQAPFKGAFYFFYEYGENDSSVKYCRVALKCIEQRIDRENFSGFRNRHVALLPVVGVTGEKVVKTFRHPWVEWFNGLRWWTKHDNTKPAMFYRVPVRGALHPLVLHSIKNSTKHMDTLDTPLVKAIATLGYNQALPYLAVQFIMQSLCVLSYLWFGRHLRKQSGEDGGDLLQIHFLDTPVARLLAWLVLGLTWFLRFIALLAEMRGLWKWGLPLYPSKIVKIVWQLTECFVLSWMSPVAAVRFPAEHILSFFTEEMARASMRLSLAGFQTACWIKVLHMLCGFELMNIGMRVNAIQATLKESYTFLLVMLLFLGAVLTLSYDITDVKFTTLLLNTYNMGFAGEYNKDTFMERDEIDEELGPSTIWTLRFVVYAFSGIMIMTALNNIFIGILGQAYDANRNTAAQLLVRERAGVALEWAWLCSPGNRHDEDLLWVCAPETEASKDNVVQGTKSRLDRIDASLADMETKLDRVLVSIRQPGYGGVGKSLLTKSF